MKPKLIDLIKSVLTISFLKFCIVGVINTVIHIIIYNLLYQYGGTFANTIAFIFASIFSYFANAMFTYKEKVKTRTFILSILVFIVKLIISDLLEYGFTSLFSNTNLDYLIPYNPLFITTILLPLQFLVFNKIFKEKQSENEIVAQHEGESTSEV